MDPTPPAQGDWPVFPPPRCGRCNFGSRAFSRPEAAGLLRESAARWQQVLTDPDTTGQRVGALSWSPLEHGCHVRDMCLLFHQRLDAVLGPSAAAPGAGEPAAAPAEFPVLYRDEDPGRAAEELGRAAEELARRLERLTGDDWDRGDTRFPGARLTVDFFTRHLLHDIVHDLCEVLRAGRRAGGNTAPGSGPRREKERSS
ncbi:DinB family protein [Streptomyces sp. NPDC001985]|uniref:DinB family protein n=1 Tax=Streptomyces sp. NPDC001985 TaxID=3154406 RepID=UPI0033281632